MRAHDWEPLEPYPGSRAPWRCRCLRCGIEAAPKLHGQARVRGCAGCSGRVGRISEQSSVAVMRDAGWIPHQPFPGPREKWCCACAACGRVSHPRYETVKSTGSGCRFCAAARNGEARRRRFEPTALATMRTARLEPLEPFPGANQPWTCMCTRCGQTTTPTYSNVTSGGRGCETCRRKAQGESARANTATHAEEQIRRAGYRPIEPYPGAEHPWSCRCRCGRETRVRVGNVVAGQRGCRACAASGFNSKRPAIVYLLHHPQLAALKVGVTNTESTRVARFRRHGWQVLAIERFSVGLSALRVEDSILTWWRHELQLGPLLTDRDTPIGGWTETVDADSVQPAEAIEYLAKLIAAGRSGQRHGGGLGT